MKIGLIINPLAGIGGKVGLKGSDGEETVRKALALGAVPESGTKTLEALDVLKEIASNFELYTYPEAMGGALCKEIGIPCKIIGKISSPRTTGEDTVRAARELKELSSDLIVFAGGDGTARNIMDAVGTDITVIGIPTGCKIHSGVYALTPRRAGELVRDYILGKVRDTHEAEVMDIDEKLFRQGRVQAHLYGYLRIPSASNLVQNLKSGRASSETTSIEQLSDYIARSMSEDTLYIVGTGSTTAAIMKKLQLPYTLLGVDLVYGKKVIASDCTELEILRCLDKYDGLKKKIIVTVIGGQGYIFGRGNQQISSAVIERVGKENIVVVASKNKMASLFGRPLYIDTGDRATNQLLCGYMKVIVGYEEAVMARVTD